MVSWVAVWSILRRRLPGVAVAAYVGAAALAQNTAAQNAGEHPSISTAPLADVGSLPVQRSPMPLLSVLRLPPSTLLRGSAQTTAVVQRGATSGSADGAPPQPSASRPGVSSEAFGSASMLAIAPYTTARASAAKLGLAPSIAAEVGVTSYPLRATGKLYFKIAGVDYVCTASLVKPGVLLTAAHCVFEFGTVQAGWHTDFVFAPAQYASGSAPPYGTWTALSEVVPGPYRLGTDTCLVRGVACNNDVAAIVVRPNKAGQLPGNVVGWYGYGWGGYSSVPSFGGAMLSSITQLGYPVAFDGGLMLERNDGVGGLWASGALRNTVLGTALTGGSSGGPWLVNFGAAPSLDEAGASLGTSSLSNVVVGVTSWGYSAVGVNTQGASWFGPNKEYPGSSYKDIYGNDRGAGNIGAVMRAACSVRPDVC